MSAYKSECARCLGRGVIGDTKEICPICVGVGSVGLDNVVNSHVLTRHDIKPDEMLRAAIGVLETVVIVGYDKNGAEYFASSTADGGTSLWMLSRAKLHLLSIVDETED